MIIGINGGYFPAICRVCSSIISIPNHAYWNQRRLFSGNVPGIFLVQRFGYDFVRILGWFWWCNEFYANLEIFHVF